MRFTFASIAFKAFALVFLYAVPGGNPLPPRILITRAPHQASALADALRVCGLEPILIPAIEITDPTTFTPLDASIATLHEGSVDWLLFTSANAVERFSKRILGTEFEAPVAFNPVNSQLKIGVIGPATARAVEQFLGTHPTLIPPQAVAESLAKALIPYVIKANGKPTRFLLMRAEIAPDTLPDVLRAAGAEITVVPTYKTVIPTDSIAKIRKLFHSRETYPDAIAFTSSSTVTNLLALLEMADMKLPADVKRISIGPITSQTLVENGLSPHAEANDASVSSLVSSILECVN